MVACACSTVGWPAAAQDQSEALATRRFQSGVEFAREGSHEQALTDFTAVIDLYPTSDVVDNALLEVARYHLSLRDGQRARAAAERIVNNPSYSQGDAALGAYIVLGRAMMMTARGEAERRDALASFQRGVRLHPNNNAVPEAMYQVAATLQRLGRVDAAFDAYQQLMTAYPQSDWAIRARLGAGTMRMFRGDPIGAMEEFQRIRDEFAERPEAAAALARTTILYRLHVRPPNSMYTVSFAGGGRRINRDVIGLATDADGNVVFATDRGVGSFTSGVPLPTVDRPRGLTVDRAGNVAVFGRGLLLRTVGPAIGLVVPERNERRPLTEVDAGVELSNGEWLVADGDREAVLRFREGNYLGIYADLEVERLAVDADDRVAVLDNDERIALYADARRFATLPARTSAYRIDNPVDVAFDVLGHLYVLDREGIYVFSRNLRLLRAFPGNSSATVPFDRATALWVDPYGRLFVADRRDDRIYVLQ